jgi:peptidoglycan/LPS O-acetylase OafA/YrhL
METTVLPAQLETQTATKAPEGKASRVSALDFTKGALVLIMVLYHWIDYFIGSTLELFRYLRFLTPSFICISGFLISSVYLAKYDIRDNRIPKRLAERGLKILGIFVALNLLIGFLFRDSSNGRMVFASISSLENIFIAGNTVVPGVGKAAAFIVLVPISYLLLFSAGLMIVCRYFKYAFQAVFLSCLVAIGALYLQGMQSGNLELLAIGFLGVIIGYVPFDKVNRVVAHTYLLVFGYICYLAAVTLWNVIYPLQIVGVCLTLALIYLVGVRTAEPGGVAKRIVVLLGKYSLLGYIVQILILQLLRKGLRLFEPGPALLAISFLAAVLLTILAVAATNTLRAKSTVVDGMYRAVFS